MSSSLHASIRSRGAEVNGHPTMQCEKSDIRCGRPAPAPEPRGQSKPSPWRSSGVLELTGTSGVLIPGKNSEQEVPCEFLVYPSAAPWRSRRLRRLRHCRPSSILKPALWSTLKAGDTIGAAVGTAAAGSSISAPDGSSSVARTGPAEVGSGAPMDPAKAGGTRASGPGTIGHSVGIPDLTGVQRQSRTLPRLSPLHDRR